MLEVRVKFEFKALRRRGRQYGTRPERMAKALFCRPHSPVAAGMTEKRQDSRVRNKEKRTGGQE
jgi:hypothetical protein